MRFIILLITLFTNLGFSQSNAEYSVPTGTRIIESKMITNNLFLTTYQSSEGLYINVNGTINGPYLSITKMYLSDDGRQYSYQYLKSESDKQIGLYHLVVNGQNYITNYHDTVWSLNRQHFAYVNKKLSSSDIQTLYVDGKEVTISPSIKGTEFIDKYSVGNDGKYSGIYKSTDGSSRLNSNGTVYQVPYNGYPQLSQNGAHFSFRIDRTHINVDGQIISITDDYRDFYFSENGEHYIFSYPLEGSMGTKFGINIDGKNLDISTLSYASVNLNETSISNDGTYRFIGLKSPETNNFTSLDLKIVISNINGNLTEYTRDIAVKIENSMYDGKNFFFSFSTNGKFEIYKNDILLARDVGYISDYNKTSEGKITFYFDNKIYYDTQVYGPYEVVYSPKDNNIGVYLLGGDDVFIKGKILKGLSKNWSNIRQTLQGFYSVDVGLDTININGITSKISNTQIQDIYLSEDLSISSYIDGTKLKVAPTSSLLQVADSIKLVPKTIDLSTSITPIVVNSTLGLYPNYEPIHIVNESNRELTMNKVIDSKTLFFHQLHINGYQSYPYVIKAPSVNEMNENNSFIGYYKTPKGYQVLSIDVVKKVDSKNDFIIKLDSKNNRYFITPTDERVHREMYTIDNDKIENHYDLTVTYQQGKLKAKKMMVKDSIFYEYGFNFDRDSFSLNNSPEDLVSGYPSLLTVKLLYPGLHIYRTEPDTNGKELKQIELFGKDLQKVLLSGILESRKTGQIINYGVIYNGKELNFDSTVKLSDRSPNSFFTFLERHSKFSGFCYGFVNRGLSYLNQRVSLSEWNTMQSNINTITNSTKLEGGSKEFSTTLNYTPTEVSGLNLSQLLAKDWLRQYTIPGSGVLVPENINLRPTLVALTTSKGNSGHAVLGYKEESYSDLKRFKIDLTGNKSGKPVLYYDKDNNETFTQCLDKDPWSVVCSKTPDLTNLTELKRIYIYDNDFKDYKEASIFIYNTGKGQSQWVLNTFIGINKNVIPNELIFYFGDLSLLKTNSLEKGNIDSILPNNYYLTK